MSVPALRQSLAAWTRHPRELGLANGLAFLAAALPLPLLLEISGVARRLALVLMALWAWLAFNALAAYCVEVLGGPAWQWRTWLRTRVLERLVSLLAVLLLEAWAGLALWFYLRLDLPPWAQLPVLALLGSLMLWAALALLASVGVSALGLGSWKQIWKASALLPLAFAPAWLGAGLLALALSGLPALLVGLKHWSAPLLFAPVALSPLFTPAFYAAFLVLLVRGLAEKAAGGTGPLAPEWRELWNPWR